MLVVRIMFSLSTQFNLNRNIILLYIVQLNNVQENRIIITLFFFVLASNNENIIILYICGIKLYFRCDLFFSQFGNIAKRHHGDSANINTLVLFLTISSKLHKTFLKFALIAHDTLYFEFLQ